MRSSQSLESQQIPEKFRAPAHPMTQKKSGMQSDKMLFSARNLRLFLAAANSSFSRRRIPNEIGFCCGQGSGVLMVPGVSRVPARPALCVGLCSGASSMVLWEQEDCCRILRMSREPKKKGAAAPSVSGQKHGCIQPWPCNASGTCMSGFAGRPVRKRDDLGRTLLAFER